MSGLSSRGVVRPSRIHPDHTRKACQVSSNRICDSPEPGRGWREYHVTEEEEDEFARFISANLEKMRPMAHSCRMYNMTPSAPIQLRVPLLFFVIESFFEDVKAEVVFRIALYVTRILGEDNEFWENLKTLYEIRSGISHGNMVLVFRV